MTKKWYVLRTFSGQEAKVKTDLEFSIEKRGLKDVFGKILLPTQKVVSVSGGKKTTRERKFFPSYLIVEMEMNKDAYHFVTETPRVTNFVGINEPQPLRQIEIDRIFSDMGLVEKTETSVVVDCPFTVSQPVKIKDGPFKEFDGVVQEIIDGKNKVRVSVSVFGRSTPVELQFYQLEALT